MTLKTILACILAAGIAMSAAAQDLKPVKDKQTQKYGYQAKDKSWVIAPAFDNAKRFSDGYAEVTVDGRIGLIDANGDWVFPAEYDDISKFYKNGLCELMRKEGRAKLRGAGDQTGRIIVPVDGASTPRTGARSSRRSSPRRLLSATAWPSSSPRPTAWRASLTSKAAWTFRSSICRSAPMDRNTCP